MLKFKNTSIILAIACIFGFRMLGLFMMIPIISIYAYQMPNASLTLAGIALGIYGLTQACLQLPFGMLSDKWGRKNVIYLGLTIFAVGSIIAALSSNVYGLIMGRALQGAGAIGSTLIATVADFSSEKHRTKAMALIGMTIGTSFMLGFLIGPLLSFYYGVKMLFWLTALLAIIGMLICFFIIPNSDKLQFHADSGTLLKLIPLVITNKQLLRLDLGILFQHAIMTALFTVLPFIFKNNLGITRAEQWKLYLPLLVGTFAFSIPIILFAEKYNRLKEVFICMLGFIILAQICLYMMFDQYYGIIGGLTLYFIAFNVLEATLPSMISKTAPITAKGTAMGIYSTSQFFGIFVGAAIAGFLFGHHHIGMVFIFTLILAIAWLFTAFGMRTPPQSRSYQLDFDGSVQKNIQELKLKLKQYAGILDIAILPDESSVYIKVDKHRFDESLLHEIKTHLTT